MINTSKKAILYLRVSTEEQVENYSLGTQEEICKREAQYRGYEVTQIFREEGKSAKTIKGRTTLIQLLEFCRKNRQEVDAVIVYKTDRLSRQIFDYLIIQQKLGDLKIKLISATEPTGDSAMGKFLGGFFAQIAQYDNDMRGERSRNGMRARFKAGLYHNGHPPMGYLSFEKMLVKDPKTFDKLKAAWDLMATGTKTLKEMSQIMTKWGIPTRHQTMQRIFRSKFYTGILCSKTYQEEVLGQHPPMITKNQFDKVQAILDGRNRSKPILSRRNRDNPDFPLRRFTKCSKCGKSLTGAWSKGRGGRYAYYFCSNRNNCCPINIPAKDLHKELMGLLQTITVTPEGKTIFWQLLESEYRKRISVIRQKEVNREQQLKKIRSLQKTLIEKHLTGVYSDDIFTAENELIEKNIKSLETVTNTNFIKQYNLLSAREFITNHVVNPAFVYQTADIGQKKDILSLLFPNGFIWNYPGLIFQKLNPLFKHL